MKATTDQDEIGGMPENASNDEHDLDPSAVHNPLNPSPFGKRYPYIAGHSRRNAISWHPDITEEDDKQATQATEKRTERKKQETQLTNEVEPASKTVENCSKPAAWICVSSIPEYYSVNKHFARRKVQRLIEPIV
jgi:hypothetical protein